MKIKAIGRQRFKVHDIRTQADGWDCGTLEWRCYVDERIIIHERMHPWLIKRFVFRIRQAKVQILPERILLDPLSALQLSPRLHRRVPDATPALPQSQAHRCHTYRQVMSTVNTSSTKIYLHSHSLFCLSLLEEVVSCKYDPMALLGLRPVWLGEFLFAQDTLFPVRTLGWENSLTFYSILIWLNWFRSSLLGDRTERTDLKIKFLM